MTGPRPSGSGQAIIPGPHHYGRRSECDAGLSNITRVILMFAITLSAVGCAAMRPAQVAATIQPWSQDGFTGRRITTEHFEIISTLRDAEFEAALPGFVEAVYEHYEATLPAAAEVSPKLAMYVFGTRPEWTRFTRRRFPARVSVYSKIRSGGYTEGNVSALFYANRSSTLATIAHEGWHQYLAGQFKNPIPAWLNEGLACYMEAVDCAGPKPRFTPRRNTFRINSLREAVQQDTLMSLPELVNTNAGEVIGRDHSRLTQGYYAQTWALITFLRHGAGGHYASAFDGMLRDIADGTYAIRVGAARLGTSEGGRLSPGEAVFRAYFERSPDDLADQYYDHLIRICGY